MRLQHFRQKVPQGRQRRHVDKRGRRKCCLARARRAVEHPGWDLEPAIRLRPAQRATEINTASLADRPMDANAKAKPRVPSIQKFSKASPVGVLKPCCTTMSGRIYPWIRMHRLFVLFSGSVTSPRGRSSADFIMNTAGRSIQQGQEAEIVFLRHQLTCCGVGFPPSHGSRQRTDCSLSGFIALCRRCLTLRSSSQPDTIVRWHRAGFRSYWRRGPNAHNYWPAPLRRQFDLRQMERQQEAGDGRQHHGRSAPEGRLRDGRSGLYGLRRKPSMEPSWNLFLNTETGNVTWMQGTVSRWDVVANPKVA